jgi:hypothetical protein
MAEEEGEGEHYPWVMIAGAVLLLLLLGIGIAILTNSMPSVQNALKGIVDAINNVGMGKFR